MREREILTTMGDQLQAMRCGLAHGEDGKLPMGPKENYIYFV